MTTLTQTDVDPADLQADVLVLATTTATAGRDGGPTGGPSATLLPGHGLPEAAASHLESALAALGATGKVDDVHRLPAVPGIAATTVVLTGVGGTGGADGGSAAGAPAAGTEGLRRGAGAAVRAALRGGKAVATIGLALPATSAEHLAAIAEGAISGGYAFTAHKSASDDRPELSLTVATSLASEEAGTVSDRAEVLGNAVSYARDLVNTAPNLLFPQSFAESVQARVAEHGAPVTITVHDETALAELGCGGILGVGQGSSRPPRIVVLEYRPEGAGAAPHVALVGKGITFDTGGVCIKPAASMLTMKSDMAGAAAVAAVVVAAARLRLPVAVTGYLCLAENMPGGNAQRPGDVVTMRDGRTVEILDTDAEGRMVLADGICLAREAGADAIVDIATLTGACMVALGTRVAGLMANDDGLLDAIRSAADRAGEPVWHLPLPADLARQLDSEVADLSHKGERWGGALTAGMFLERFTHAPTHGAASGAVSGAASDKASGNGAANGSTDDGSGTPWAHIDIAGPSFNEGAAWGHVPKGGTGFGVPTLLALLESWDA